MLAEFESRILALIDNMLETAGDDELFASGYLREHLTLAVVGLENGVNHTPTVLYQKVGASLATAIQAGELSPRDQAAGAEDVG